MRVEVRVIINDLETLIKTITRIDNRLYKLVIEK